IEGGEVDEGDGAQQPGGLPVLLYGTPGADGLGAALQRRAVHAGAADPVEVERKAGIALVPALGPGLRLGRALRVIDDLEVHSASTSAGIRRFSFSAPCTAMALVCACEMVSSE